MRRAPLITLMLLAVPSAGFAKTSLPADPVRRPVCFRTIPADTAHATRTVRVACTWRSIPPVLNPTPFFLP